MEEDKNQNPTPSPSFVRPFLYALNRMQANESLSADQYMDRAKRLLVERLGDEGSIPKCAFSQGVVGVMADHTHYFDGFALMLRMRQGVAVALRPNKLDCHRIILEGVRDLTVRDHDIPREAALSSLITAVYAGVGAPAKTFYDVSLVGSIPTGLGASFQAALTVSLVRSLNALYLKAPSDPEIRVQALEALNAWYGHRFSPAYVIGSVSNDPEPFVLIDTGTFSHLPIEIAPDSKLGRGIVEWSKDWSSSYSTLGVRNDQASKALLDLKTRGFEKLESFRNLEHRDLEQAVDAVPRRSRSPLKHLVTENRNVQKLIVAIKKSDWQFFGALMMISQASKTNDWSTTNLIHELITKEAETAALEGIFGVVQSGEGECMLVFGQPFSVPAFLDRIRELVSTHTTEEVETFII